MINMNIWKGKCRLGGKTFSWSYQEPQKEHITQVDKGVLILVKLHSNGLLISNSILRE